MRKQKRCWDCKKRIWFWQAQGVDMASHQACHWKRCLRLVDSTEPGSETRVTMIRLVNEIARFYGKTPLEFK